MKFRVRYYYYEKISNGVWLIKIGDKQILIIIKLSLLKFVILRYDLELDIQIVVMYIYMVQMKLKWEMIISLRIEWLWKDIK